MVLAVTVLQNALINFLVQKEGQQEQYIGVINVLEKEGLQGFLTKRVQNPTNWWWTKSC
jgi:hypothetical protein